MPAERALVDAYTRRALLLLRVANGLGADAGRELRALARDLRRLLADADLQAMGRRDLAALLREIETAIANRYSAIAEHQTQALYDLARTESAWATKTGHLTRPASDTAMQAVLAGLVVMGLPLSRQWGRQATNLTDRVAATVRTAQATAQAAPDLLAAIVGQGRRGRERGGLMEAARQQAATLADTSAHTAAYAGRQAAWKAGGTRYLKWHAILDQRTTLGCAARAGKIYTTDFQPVGHDIPIDQPPPRHWNCRSLLVAMAPDYAPPGDGQDAYTESLDAWLTRQPSEVQDEMLGPTRAALWRSGKVDARGLLGRGGEPLSVAALEELGAGHARSVQAFVDHAATSSAKQSALTLGKVPPSLAGELEGIGLRGDGKALALDHDNTRHILRGHGTAQTEVPRGQVPITPEDFARLPDILSQPGGLVRGDPANARDGAPLAAKTVRIGGFRYEIILKVRRRDVVPLTLYKFRA